MTDIFTYLDLYTLEILNDSRLTALDIFLISLTTTAYGVGLLVPICIYLTGHFRKMLLLKLKAFQYMFAMCLNVLFVGTLKYTINRPRPFVSHDTIKQLVDVSSPSFPSGHTAFVFTAAVSIWIMFRDVRLRGFLFVWTLLVAYSRLALGVHYPSDVLGSIVLGTTAAWMADFVFQNHRGRLLVLLKQTRKRNLRRR
ncbi:undecaprenyl-diphosphatase [Pontibacter ummariensis]|uniref:Undecaprenyl-diphosphatase n=1 Tax=Pontibacter ummariensis TaxID=1610492 RepID=A0A239L8A9_9BACT|nr:phosphatase PAP2 family protein [Pontibacter ummariensis]PRY04295.1 undecaprenyl-diphosphatase [Pontibacter ummariensis]SNT25909.1 undecaprenyl-diphosphatase [Pontibacter ummariensis]